MYLHGSRNDGLSASSSGTPYSAFALALAIEIETNSSPGGDQLAVGDVGEK